MLHMGLTPTGVWAGNLGGMRSDETLERAAAPVFLHKPSQSLEEARDVADRSIPSLISWNSCAEGKNPLGVGVGTRPRLLPPLHAPYKLSKTLVERLQARKLAGDKVGGSAGEEAGASQVPSPLQASSIRRVMR